MYPVKLLTYTTVYNPPSERLASAPASAPTRSWPAGTPPPGKRRVSGWRGWRRGEHGGPATRPGELGIRARLRRRFHATTRSARRAGKQCRCRVHPPHKDGRRLRAAVRHEPPRALRPDRPAVRPSRVHPWRASSRSPVPPSAVVRWTWRTSCTTVAGTRRCEPTAVQNWRTCCSPTNCIAGSRGRKWTSSRSPPIQAWRQRTWVAGVKTRGTDGSLRPSSRA